MSREIAEHLRYFAEIGVDGVSKDVKWRTRVSDTVAESAIDVSIWRPVVRPSLSPTGTMRMPARA